MLLAFTVHIFLRRHVTFHPYIQSVTRFQQTPAVGGTAMPVRDKPQQVLAPGVSLGQDGGRDPRTRSSGCAERWGDKGPERSHSRGAGFGESVKSEMEAVISKGAPRGLMWRRREGSTVLQKTF